MRILIVEDETKIATYLKQGLEENSFAVDIVLNGIDGLFFATHENYDLVVLDIMVPGVNGKEILKQMRDNGMKTPVIFLTAKDSICDKVECLNIGADDYMVKPFSFTELLARIHACLRRSRGEVFSELRINNLSLDPITRRVFRGAKKIELTPVEFSILEYLMQNSGRVVTRTMLSEHVWDNNFESFSNVVDVHISKLRNKVDKDFDKKMIQTVRRVGYVIEKED